MEPSFPNAGLEKPVRSLYLHWSSGMTKTLQLATNALSQRESMPIELVFPIYYVLYLLSFGNLFQRTPLFRSSYASYYLRMSPAEQSATVKSQPILEHPHSDQEMLAPNI